MAVPFLLFGSQLTSSPTQHRQACLTLGASGFSIPSPSGWNKLENRHVTMNFAFATIDVCCFGGNFSAPSFSTVKHLPTGTGGHEPLDLFGAPAAGSVTTSTSSVSVVAAKQSGNAPLQSKRTHDGTAQAHLLPPGGRPDTHGPCSSAMKNMFRRTPNT